MQRRGLYPGAAVITTHRKTFEARCRQRGYTLEDVMPCVTSQDGEMWTIDERHPKYPHPRPGLGDMVAAGLAAVGITPERVQRLTGKPCRCHQRKEALNRAGRLFGIGTPPPEKEH